MSRRCRKPFEVEAPLGSKLDAALAHWQRLLRGNAAMPFADDLILKPVEDLAADVFTLEVFERPERFRVDTARTPHAPVVEREFPGLFVDELDRCSPLEFLRSQASATVEAMAPTFYEHAPKPGAPGYRRLLMPFWEMGHVSRLLGVVDFEADAASTLK